MSEKPKNVGPRPKGKSRQDIENELFLNNDSGDDNLINNSDSDSVSDSSKNTMDDSQDIPHEDNSLVEDQLAFEQLVEDEVPVVLAEEIPFEGPEPVHPLFLIVDGDEADDEDGDREGDIIDENDDGDMGQNMQLVGGPGLVRGVVAVPRGVRGGARWRGGARHQRVGRVRVRGGRGEGARARGGDRNRGRGRGRPRGRGRGRGQEMPAG